MTLHYVRYEVFDGISRRLLGLEKRVEELEIAREQETPPAAVSGAPTVDGQHDGAAASGETAAPNLCGSESDDEDHYHAAQLGRECDKLREALQLSERERALYLRQRDDYRHERDEARAELANVQAARRALIAEAERLRPIVAERDDARGALRALQDDHESLILDHVASCEARAQLVAEVLRSARELVALQDALRTMVERAAAEIVDRKARENLLADLARVIGTEE
jgi:chromosome segregation ATPase